MKSLAKSLVLIFIAASAAFPQSTVNFTSGQAARAVIGQYTFSLGLDGATTQVLGGVSGLAYANGTLFVADDNRVGATPNNNRIMMFSTAQIPSSTADLSTFNSGDGACYLCGYPSFNVVGQPDTVSVNPGLTQSQMQNPTAVATDGQHLVVADTDNNRVLIWNTIPTAPNANADVVLGQANFTTRQPASTINATTLRGPQGVWIQGGKLFVADTQNYRVLIWNSIPTSNNKAADIVLGQPNFTSSNAPPVTKTNPTAAANQLLNPVSVTSDGQKLYVADLGFNRVLIWNSIPTQNAQNADVVVGQQDMANTAPNNNTGVCPPAGTDSSGNPTYPDQCGATLNFPRFALSDGTRLFVADGGNDRVLVFNQIPTTNGATADLVLGEPDFYTDLVSSAAASIISTSVDNTGSVDTLPSPMSLAFDGTNLYVSDPYNRRVLVYSPGNIQLGGKPVLNAASLITRQEGFVTFAGTIVAKDTVTVTIAGTDYTYTVVSGDTLQTIAQGIINAINTSNSNAGDPNVIALAGSTSDTVFLNSKSTTLDSDSISLAATSSNTANETATASGAYLTGGTSATVAPGTLVQINGTNLADTQLSAANQGGLPLNLGGVQVSMDGFQTPLMMVSPTQIVTQVPFNFYDRTSSSVYVRTTHKDGSVTVTTATPIAIAPANPGLFATPNVAEPRPVYNGNTGASFAMHPAGNPSAAISIDGTVTAGNTATITIAGATYTYTLTASDTLGTVVTGLVNAINAGNDPNVIASAGGSFSRVVLTARQPGALGNNISIAGSANSGATVVVTAYTSATCCIANGTGPVTPSNPALPNELVTFLATGLGLVNDPTGSAFNFALTGVGYSGPAANSALDSVSATVNGETGQVINAGLLPGAIGIYAVQVLMPSDLPASSNTQVYIAQDAFISNVVTVPVGYAGGLFTANPSPIYAGVGKTAGTTTLSWNASTTLASVEIHIGSATGPLFATGGYTGSATTGNWVTNGTTFYLVDPSTGNTLSTVTVPVISQGGTLTASPNPINFGANTPTCCATTLTWNAPNSTAVEVHVGGPNGPQLTSGGPQGSVTTGTWVTDGLVFYLQDASNGNSTSPSNTLSTVTVHVVLEPTTFTINPTPLIVVPGTSVATATLTWYAPAASQVEVHVGSPTGTLLTIGNNVGSVTTGNWVTDGLTFFLQDHANPLNTLASVTAHVASAQLTINPNPILATPGTGAGTATLTWSAPYSSIVEVHLGAPNGPLFAISGNTGSGQTANWVTDGLTFYLVDSATQQTIATATAHVQSQ